MPNDVYHKLREQLDQYSFGFPVTQSGVEIRILRKLFTADEAEMYLHLSLRAAESDAIAEQSGKDLEVVAALLERMADKGLIFRLRKGDSVRYGAVPFLVGSYEFQLKDMDRELAELFEEYYREALAEQAVAQPVPLRTIPVNQAIEVSWPVAPYEDVRQIIRDRDRIAVADCICRVQQKLIDKGCEKPLEACFMFGSHADYYVEKGMARLITQEEALRIIDQCDEAGLVPQPYNSLNPGGMCNCCADCCGILRAVRMHARPVEVVTSNYYAESDPELCTACEVCPDRCQMDAIDITSDGYAVVDLDRCIGCGLCVTTCPSEAMKLYLKSEEERHGPPRNAWETAVNLANQRGRSLIPLAFSKHAENE